MSELFTFPNPYKVCSDEWADRSLINSVIYCSESRLESLKEYIDDDYAEIEKYKELGYYPNPRCELIDVELGRKVDELFRIKEEINILKKDDIEDRLKLRMFWEIRNRGR